MLLKEFGLTESLEETRECTHVLLCGVSIPADEVLHPGLEELVLTS